MTETRGEKARNDFLFGELRPMEVSEKNRNPIGSLLSGVTFFTTGVVGVAIVVALVVGAIVGLGTALVKTILN